MSIASISSILVLFCCSLFAGGAVALRVGVIIDMSSRAGIEQRVAIEIATEDFNSSVTDGLSVNISDSSSKAESLIAEWGADAVITTGPWLETLPIVKIGRKAEVPVLSVASSAPLTLTPEPYFFRLSPSPSAYIQCLTDIITLYNWRQVNILYEDDNYGSTSLSVIPALNNAFRAVGSHVISHVAFPPLDLVSDPTGLVQTELKRMASQFCKVFLVVKWSSSSTAIDLFKEAGNLGMMARGHVWIVADGITTLLGSTLNTSFISSYMQGVIGIQTYKNQTSELYRDFRAKFQQKLEADSESGMPALRAYDAVQVLARARTTSSDDALLKGIQSTNFTGLSGQVQFRSHGDLAEGRGSSTFQIINIVGNGYREMGLWSKGTGFHEGSDVTPLGTVYWPGGGAGNAPGGWGTLKLGVPAVAVFDKFVKVEHDKNGEVKKVTGFCIDVFTEALRQLNYSLDYRFISFNKSYDELVAAVPETFDGVIGDVTILAKRTANATFTKPYLASGLSAFVPVRPHSTRWVLTKPFTRPVWFLLVASYIYTCITVWYLEHKDNPEFHGSWNNQVGATLWLIFSTIFFAHGKLHSYYTKMVVGVWLFVLLILTSAFTASLGSILTTQKLEPVVSDRKVGCNQVSFLVKYLQETGRYKTEQIEKIMSAENYTAAFESGNITKAYLETPYLRVFLAEHEGYTVYGDTERLGGFGFVFRKGPPLAEDFSKAILSLTEDGTLNNLEKKWFSFSMGTCPATVKDRIRESLGLDSLWTLFLITGTASTIVLLLFKARFVPAYSCHSLNVASLPLREKCASLWKDKLGNKTGLQLSRRPSLSLPQVAPEPCDGSPEIQELPRPIQGDTEDHNFQKQNNT